MESDLSGKGYVHEELFVRVALQGRFRVETVCPGFLEDERSRARGGFVEGLDGAEVDLVVDVVLESGGQVVRVVVRAAGAVIVRVGVGVLIVAVRHCCEILVGVGVCTSFALLLLMVSIVANSCCTGG